MPELRHDPLQKRWIVIAPERVRHPGTPDTATSAFCPFCAGNESATPAEIHSIRAPGSRRNDPSWSVRVIPNRSPALRVEGSLESSAEGLYDRMNGVGAHEVIIESPRHDVQMADMDYRSVEQILNVYADRQRDLFRDGRLQYVLIFKNHGTEAGATTSHPHSQIIATPVTPNIPTNKLRFAHAHWLERQRCVYCDLLQQEIASGRRVVWLDSSFVVLAPYASRFPFELLILPRTHRSNFIDASAEELAGLARVLRDTLRRLRIALGDPPFNLAIHTAPNPRPMAFPSEDWKAAPWCYHWHMEILPRITPVGGFEWGTGFFMNPIPPEDAAGFLREVAL